MKRAAKKSNIGSAIGRGLVFIFLLALLVVPSLTVVNWFGDLGLVDKRKAEPIAFSARSLDQDKPKLFEEPILSVTFDDGWGTVFTEAYPLLQKHGIKTTQYVLSGEFEDQQYMSKKQMEVMQQTGHEIGCHTVSHADLTSLSQKDMEKQLVDCKQVLSELYGTVKDFASPYSSYNDATIAAIKNVFRSHRNTNGDPTNGVGDVDVNIRKYFDIYNIISVTIHHDTTNKQIKELIDYALANNGWLVLTYHAVDEGPSEYGLDVEHLEEQLKLMSESKIRIATVGDVLNNYKQAGQQ